MYKLTWICIWLMEVHGNSRDPFVFVAKRILKFTLYVQDLVHSISQNNDSEQNEREVSHFNALVKMRYFEQLVRFKFNFGELGAIALSVSAFGIIYCNPNYIC